MLDGQPVLDRRVVGGDDADPLVPVEVLVRQVGDEPVRQHEQVGAQQDLVGPVDRRGVFALSRSRACGASSASSAAIESPRTATP